jgi:hypothetical protein
VRFIFPGEHGIIGFRLHYRKEGTMPTSTSTPTLPTREELDAAWSALADAEDEHVHPILRRVLAVVNEDDASAKDEKEAFWADSGVLICFVRECRAMLEMVGEHLTKLERAALVDVEQLARTGEMANVPQYDELGEPNLDRLAAVR